MYTCIIYIPAYTIDRVHNLFVTAPSFLVHRLKMVSLDRTKQIGRKLEVTI